MSSARDRVLHLPVETEEMDDVVSPDRERLLMGGDGTNPKVHIQVNSGRTDLLTRCIGTLKEPLDALRQKSKRGKAVALQHPCRW
jgi:hypothetical protein